MLKKILKNAKKPKGMLGKLALWKMNNEHAKIANWCFSDLDLLDKSHYLDIGCGGGVNILKLLEDKPQSIVDGLDYSIESVKYSKKTNFAYLNKRCQIHHGDVMQLPYQNECLDYVTAFETIYFWPDLDGAFKEIKRVLKLGGMFIICCATDNPNNTYWTDNIEGMTIYTGENLKNRLIGCGYTNVKLKRCENGWICVKAINAD